MSALETRVMDALWAVGSGTVAEILEMLSTSRGALQNSTIRTVLSRLEQKGYVTHRSDGRKNLYRPLYSRRREAVRRAREILDRFWDGSIERLVVGLVENERLNSGDVERLIERIKTARKTEDDTR